jgi:hypothetical protein
MEMAFPPALEKAIVALAVDYAVGTVTRATVG